MDFNAIDVENGDCFAIGQPWTAEEAYAVRNLGIPADMVREGILTTEAMEEAQGGKKSKKGKKDADDAEANTADADADAGQDTGLTDSTTNASAKTREAALKGEKTTKK